MSWWDTSGLTSFANNVVKSAQQKIDKVLDIEEESGAAPKEKKPAERQGDFWNTWLGSPGDNATVEKSPTSKKSPTTKGSSGKKSIASSWRSWGLEDSSTEDVKPLTEPHSPRQVKEKFLGETSTVTATPGRLKFPTGRKPESEEFGINISDSDKLYNEESSPVNITVETSNVKVGEAVDSGVAEPSLQGAPEPGSIDVLVVTETGDAPSSEADDSVIHGTRLPQVTSSVVNTEAHPGLLEAKADKVVEEPVLHDDLSRAQGHKTKDFISDVNVHEHINRNVLIQEPEIQTLSHTSGDFDLSESSDTLGKDIHVHLKKDELLTGTREAQQTGAWEEERQISAAKVRQQIGADGDLEHTGAIEDTQEQTTAKDTQRVSSVEVTGLPQIVQDEDASTANTVDDALQASTAIDATLLDEGSEVTIQTRNLDNDNVEAASSQHEVDSVSEKFSVSGMCGSARSDTVGLSMIAEAGSDTDSVNDDFMKTSEVRPGNESQATSNDTVNDVSDTEKQVVGSFLTVGDQTLDKSVSTTSSIEIVSETEIEKVQGTKESSNSEVTISVDTDHSDQRVSGEVSLSGESSTDPSLVTQEQSDSSDVSHLDSSVDTCVAVDTVHSGDENLDDNSNETGLEKDTELSVSDGCSMTVSSSSSVVKTMLEEAMEDSMKHEECDSHSHSSSDKSDFVKSEFSDKSISGHESGDEIDTTTSSDIEIISTPTPNGDRHERPFDLSPLKIALSRAGRRGSPKHRRSDSQSSSSTNSKPEQLSPGRDMEFAEDGPDSMLDLSGHYQQGQSIENPNVTSDVRNDPYETEKLLKPTTGQTKEWAQKMAEMAEVINARENKLVQLSKENNDLLEGNSILRNQLKQSEETREAEMEDVNILTEEFTQRLGEAERKLQLSLREKDSLKKQLEITQMEMVKKGDTSKFQKMLSEKDEQIKELLDEGEKLSKQQLQGSTIIKKLRSKEKENEQVIQSQKKKLETQSSELEHLKVVLDSKEDMEKKQSDAIGQLNNAVQRQEKEIAKLKGELEENHEKMRGMQTALDASYKEIAELHRANAAKDSQAQEVAVSAEMQAREELRFTIERENQRYRQEKEGLIMQIEDLRISLSRMEKEYGRREDMLRQEISDLQQRLQEDEARNQELTQSVTSATRPLLRQIENLQSTYMAQSNSWETVERNITERLGDAQTQLAVAIEKERMGSEKVLELTAQVTTLEAQNTRYRQEKSQLTAQHEMLKTKIELLEDSKHSDLAQVEAVRQNLNQTISELKREKILLENQLEMEKTKSENERKKVILLQEQLKEERERPRSRGTPSPALVTRQESISSIQDPLVQLPAFTQEELLERSLMIAPHSPNGNKMTLYETLRQTGAANLLESLTSQLKQREGEITQLQSEITELERTRESMARELVNLSTQNDDLKDQIEGLPQLEAKHADLEQRYNALLQMYGEKVEETEELKLDLQDVKELYKSQIDHLMKSH